MPLPGYIWFHVVSGDEVTLQTPGGSAVRLGRGDLALVPHGEGHVLRSEPAAPAPPILELELERVSDRYDVLRHGGGGPATTLICGAVRFDHPAARNLVGILPEIVHVERRDARQEGSTESRRWV